MKILNIGSLNLDYVYRVDHIVAPGETEATACMQVFPGGKGFNQSVALARAGVEVYHGGMIGQDGTLFLEECKKYGVNGRYIKTVEGKTGHTIIQVEKSGQNSILLFGGANQEITKAYVEEVIKDFTAEDMLLVQNEISQLPYIIEVAAKQGMKIAMNPSPLNDKLKACDLDKIHIFLMNEIEGEQITGKKNPDEILVEMHKRYPKAKVLLTLGKDGALYGDETGTFRQEIVKVKAVDTTAAGDTFTGFFLAGLLAGKEMKKVLERATRASALAVTREGAAPSIPSIEEVENFK